MNPCQLCVSGLGQGKWTICLQGAGRWGLLFSEDLPQRPWWHQPQQRMVESGRTGCHLSSSPSFPGNAPPEKERERADEIFVQVKSSYRKSIWGSRDSWIISSQCLFSVFFSSMGLQLMSFLINFFNYWFLFEVLPLQWLEDFKHTLVSYFL